MHVQKLLERAYGRVNRTQLRDHLLSRCAATGVTYVPAVVTDIDAKPDAESVEIFTTKGDKPVRARLATLAGGAVSSKFLEFETHAPRVAAQTAYGITARVKNYSDAFEPSTMVFMDYRRLHRCAYLVLQGFFRLHVLSVMLKLHRVCWLVYHLKRTLLVLSWGGRRACNCFHHSMEITWNMLCFSHILREWYERFPNRLVCCPSGCKYSAVRCLTSKIE